MKTIEELREKETMLQVKLNEVRSELLTVQKALNELELRDVTGKIFTNKRYGRCKVVGIKNGYLQLKWIKANGEAYRVVTETAYKLDRFLEDSKEV